MRISKKEVRKFVQEFKNGLPFNWSINNCYVLILDNKIVFKMEYNGQGIYDGIYTDKIDIKDIMEDYKGINKYGLNTIEDATTLIYERIKEHLD